MELAHALDFVEVYDEACVVRVMQADAFTAKDSQVVRAVEVLHALRVLLAQLFSKGVLVLFASGTARLLEVEVSLGQNGVLLNYLIEDVDVKGEPLRALQLLNEFAADRAPYSVVVVQVLDARGAQSVPAVYQDAGNTLSHIVPEAAKLADVESSGRIVKV